MIWNVSPDQLRKPLFTFVGIILVCSAFYGWGYYGGYTHAAKDVKALKAQADTFKAQAEAAANRGAALKVDVAKAEPRIQAAHTRVEKADAKVAALHLPDKLPNTPAFLSIATLREDVAAVKAENVELKIQNNLLKQEAAQYEDAFHKERLRSMALEGQLAAQKANQGKLMFKTFVRGLTVGGGVGFAGGFFIAKK